MIYSLGSMFSLRRSTCVLILSYKLWRFSTAVSMVSYNLRPSEKKYILKFNHTEYRGFASILTKTDNLLYWYAHANMCLPLCWTRWLILLFFWRQERLNALLTAHCLNNMAFTMALSLGGVSPPFAKFRKQQLPTYLERRCTKKPFGDI